ncbi:ATP-binding protein [Lysinibacillus sp. NPDC056959]|uniref:ATP-binding protein n=1 Tax=Lysinibacillus sp. NPDC056959 TaxID=3345981 RepID=UPI00363E15AA
MNVKLALSSLIVLFISVLLSFFISKTVITNQLEEQVVTELDGIVQFIETESYEQSLENLLVHLNQLTNYHVKHVQAADLLNEYSQADLSQISNGHPLVRVSNPNDIVAFYSYTNNNEKILLQFNMKEHIETMNAMKLIVKLALFIGLFLIFIASYYISKPIKQLTKATNKIAQGQFDMTLKSNRKDEIGQLTNSFNLMATSVQSMLKVRQDFISNVSHEYQTPITSIKGFAKALREKEFSKATQQEYLFIIEEEAERLSNLSTNVLKLSRLQYDEVKKLDITAFSIDRMLKETITLLYPQSNKKNIEWNVQLESITIHADVQLLKQLWINLLSNAIRYSPVSGIISITCIENENNKIHITITDEGPGIGDEHLANVFDPFYKSKDSPGNGLGLSIVKEIVQKHHANIRLLNREPHGLKIDLVFPKEHNILKC